MDRPENDRFAWVPGPFVSLSTSGLPTNIPDKLFGLHRTQFYGLKLTLNWILVTAYSYLPPAHEVCDGYVFTRVCLSTGGEGGVPGQVHPRAGTHTPTQTRYTPPDQVHPPEQCMLGDTGNKRAVRILLKCILVCITFIHKLNLMAHVVVWQKQC